MRTVLQFFVATKRSMLVASLSLSMLVERDAPLGELLSLLFSRQLLFSMDTQWTSLVSPTNRGNQFLGLSEWFPEPTGEIVVVVLLLCGSSTTVRNQASTDAWSVSSVATVDHGLRFAVDLCLVSRTVPAGDPSFPIE